MSIQVACGCGQKLKVSASLAGKKGKCPSCGAAIAIPAPTPVESPEPEAIGLRIREPQVAVKASPNLDYLDDTGPGGPPTVPNSLKGKRRKKTIGAGQIARRVRCPGCRHVFEEPFDGTAQQLRLRQWWWLIDDGPWQHCPKCEKHFDIKAMLTPVVGICVAITMVAILVLRGRGIALDMMGSLTSYQPPDLPNLAGAETVLLPFFVGAKGGMFELVIAAILALVLLFLFFGGLAIGAWSIYRIRYGYIQRT
jgi:hypothetical protein